MSEAPPRQQVNGSETIRMGQTNGLPHYDAPSAHDAGTSYREIPPEGALARRRTAGEDSAYAILKAFQDYMEHERKRSQRRAVATVTAFSVLFGILIFGFAAIWFTTMKGMQGTQSDLLKAVLTVREESHQPPSQIDVAAAIASAAEKAAGAERAVAAALLEERLAAERKKGAEEAAAREATLADTLKSLNATIDSIRKDNEALRKESEILRAETAKAQDAARAAEEAAKAARAPKAVPKPKPAPEAAKTAAVEAPATEPAAPAPKPDAAPDAAKTPPVFPQASGDSFVVHSGRPTVSEVRPPVGVKRPAPPKGYSSSTLSLPIGEKGDSQINWRIFLPAATVAPATMAEPAATAEPAP